MEREMLNFVLRDNHYIEGGTKEACIKVRDFLHYAQLSGNKIISANTCVSAEEFAEAVIGNIKINNIAIKTEKNVLLFFIALTSNYSYKTIISE